MINKRAFDFPLKLAAPGNLAPGCLDALLEYSPYLYSVYLPPPLRLSLSQRIFRGDARKYEKQLYSYMEKLNDAGVQACLAFNGSFRERGRVESLKYLEFLVKHGFNLGVVSPFPGFLKEIHRCLPGIELSNSVGFQIRSAEQARNLSQEIGLSLIQVPREYNRSLSRLRQYKDAGLRIKILANNRCRPRGGRMCQEHFDLLLPEKLSEKYIFSQPRKLEIEKECFGLVAENPYSLAQMTILPCMVHRLKGLCDVLKLDGRFMESAEEVVYLVESYLEGKSHWSKFDLLEPDEAFDRIGQCDRDCRQCDWCGKHLQTVLPRYRRDTQHIIQSYLEKLEPIRFSSQTDSAASRELVALLVPDLLRRRPRKLEIHAVREGDKVWLRFKNQDQSFSITVEPAGRSVRSFFAAGSSLAVQYIVDKPVSRAQESFIHEQCWNIASLRVSWEEVESAALKRPAPVPFLALPYVRAVLLSFCASRCVFCEESVPWVLGDGLEARNQISRRDDTGAFLSCLRGQDLTDRDFLIMGIDPFFLTSLPGIIRTAAARGARRIGVLGTGQSLENSRWAAELAAAGINCAMLHLFGGCAAEHDSVAGVDGAFSATIKACRHMRDHGVEIEVAVPLTPAQMDMLPSMLDILPVQVSAVHLLAINRHTSLPAEHANLLHPYPELLARLSPLMRSLSGPVHLHGLPPCVLKTAWKDLLLHPAPVFLSGSKKFQFKVTACEQCGAGSWCAGPSRHYVERFGSADFHPIVWQGTGAGQHLPPPAGIERA
jgi:hypothetical protein